MLLFLAAKIKQIALQDLMNTKLFNFFLNTSKKCNKNNKTSAYA